MVKKTTAADDLRNNVEEKIEQSRSSTQPEHTSARETVKPVRDNGAPTIGQQEPEEVLTVNKTNTDSEINVDELSDEERAEHDMLHMNLNNVNPNANNSAGTKKHNTGQVNKNIKDPDDGDPEKSKFDIQQGDIIEFMMKEIVLASAAWAGDKVCGYTGLYAYRFGSWSYHGIKKVTYDPLAKEYREWRKNCEKKRNETLAAANQTQTQPDETMPNDNDDQTTAFMKDTLARHQQHMEDNKVLEQRELIEKLAGMAIDGQLENRYFDDLSPTINKALQQIAKNAKGLSSQENKDAAKEQVTDLIMDFATNEASMRAFASNYASARLMQAKAANKDAFDGQDDDANYKALVEQGRIIMLMEMKKINSGQSNYKDVNELVSASAEAHLHAKEQIKKGNYNEKDKAPEKNAKLEELSQLWTNAREEERSKDEKTLMQEAKEATQKQEELNRKKEQVDREADAAEGDNEQHREKRGRFKERVKKIFNKKDKSKGNDEQTPTKPKSHDGGR